MKIVDIVGEVVGQVRILGVVPDHLHRVEVRGVGRQPFHLQPRGAGLLQETDRLATGTGTVEDQQELASHLPVDEAEERQDLCEADVVAMELEVQPQAAAQGCQGDSGNDREPIVTVPAVLHRCLSPGRPGAAHQRLKQEAGLVEHDDAPAFFTGFFFDPGPILPPPALHGGLVPLAGPALRLLGGEVQRPQQTPDMPRVVLHPEGALDHLGHPGQGPQVGGEAGRLGSLAEDLLQALLLFGGQARSGARMGLGLQALQALPLHDALPAMHGSGGGPHEAGHLADALALQQEPAGQPTTHFQLLCTALGSHSP